MAIQKKPTALPPEVLAAAKERAAQARKRIEEVGRSGLHTPEEKADAAPFYFVLRNYIRQLKTAREAARLTLTEVATRSGLALESLSRLETGAQTNPTWRTLGLYAVAIGCAPDLKVESAPSVSEVQVAQSSQGPQGIGKRVDDSREPKASPYLARTATVSHSRTVGFAANHPSVAG
jgi:transcriptional regulator with XRE-family HTH domain